MCIIAAHTINTHPLTIMREGARVSNWSRRPYAMSSSSFWHYERSEGINVDGNLMTPREWVHLTARASIDILHLKNYYDLLTSALDFPEREGERERKKREREREKERSDRQNKSSARSSHPIHFWHLAKKSPDTAIWVTFLFIVPLEFNYNSTLGNFTGRKC